MTGESYTTSSLLQYEASDKSGAVRELQPLEFLGPYDRSKVRPGIAHLGVGNFHRAHQAVYGDRHLELPGHEQWGILGIGILDTPAERLKAQILSRQGGLYSLTVFSPTEAAKCSVIGSVVEYIHAPDNPLLVLQRLASPEIRIVTITVTEWGYNLDSFGAFRFDAPDIAHDLISNTPKTIFGFLYEALRKRRNEGIGPFSVMSCDNLHHNGQVIRRALLAFTQRKDPDLADWIEKNVTFPSCMVDRITPATTAKDVLRLNMASGYHDDAPVYAEDFIQWVIEDNFCAGRPRWEEVGVQFTNDVAPYEEVKIRMLNAAHSMLAYPGILMGYRQVDAALRDIRIRNYLSGFLYEDAGPFLSSPPGMSVMAYGELLLSRFSNAEVGDQLLRIGSEGMRKIPVFLHDTVLSVLKTGGNHSRLAFLLAAFCEYLRGVDDDQSAFPVIETNYGPKDISLINDIDLLKGLDISIFKCWGLNNYEKFRDDFISIRQTIREYGCEKAIGHFF